MLVFFIQSFNFVMLSVLVFFLSFREIGRWQGVTKGTK